MITSRLTSAIAFTLMVYGLRAQVKANREPFFAGSIAFHHSPKMEFSNFPVSLRSIPLHPQDFYLAGFPAASGILPEKTLILHRPSGIDITIVTNRYPLVIGLVYIVHANAMATNSRNTTQRYQQNQYGNELRGEGTSLRFYEIASEYSQLAAIAGLKSKWYKISDNLGLRIEAGAVYDITGMGVYAQSGYDRYNSDALYARNQIGILKESRAYITFELGDLSYAQRPPNQRTLFKLIIIRPFNKFTLVDPGQDPIKYRMTSIIPFSVGMGVTF